MHGNLEPEEHVMEESVRYPGPMLGQLALALEELGWDANDEVAVEIGGVAVTGTATNPNGNPKWSKPFGTVTYQNDAFIVIKNKTRSPFVPSQPNPDLKQKHSIDSKE